MDTVTPIACALVIGLERYSGAESEINGPADDAADFVGWLRSRDVPATNIVLLVSNLNDAASRIASLRNQGVKVLPTVAEQVTFTHVRLALKELQRMSKDCDHLYVFASGHGRVADRRTQQLLLDDYSVDDMQVLDCENLANHLRWDGKYPRDQFFLFDMCGTDFSSHAVGITTAVNGLPFGRFQPDCRQSGLFAASPGATAGISESKRRSEFWLQVLPILSSVPAGTLPDGNAIKTQLGDNSKSYDVAFGIPGYALKFEQAGHQQFSRGWYAAITVLGLLLLTGIVSLGIWSLKSYYTSVVSNHVESIRSATTPSAAVSAITEAESSWYSGGVTRSLHSAATVNGLNGNEVSALCLLNSVDDPAISFPLANREDQTVSTHVTQVLASARDWDVQLTEWLSSALQKTDPQMSDRAYVLACSVAEAINAGRSDSLTPKVLERLAQSYETHPDPGVHSALSALLRRAHYDLSMVETRLLQLRPDKIAIPEALRNNRPTWYITSAGRTMIVVSPGSFNAARPAGWKDQNDAVQDGPVTVRQWFAIASFETKAGEYRQFANAHAAELAVPADELFSELRSFGGQVQPWLDNPECAATRVKWQRAVEFCNWVSTKEGLPQLPTVQVELDSFTGYRLPLEAEWEWACRAGSATSRFFGNDVGVTKMFAHFGDEARLASGGYSPTRPGTKLPNRLGLFDTYANVEEWCIDRWQKDMTGSSYTYTWFPPGTTADGNRPMRGQSFAAKSDSSIFSSFRQPLGSEMYEAKKGGLRLCRTIIPTDYSTSSIPADQ